MSDQHGYIHRFIDCPWFERDDTAEFKHEHTAGDVRRVTCFSCKARIVNRLFARDWSQLTNDEHVVLALNAAEAEGDHE